MVRNYDKKKYVAVFVVTVIIFLLGLSIGFIFDKGKIEELRDINQRQSLDYVSLQLQYTLLNEFNENISCGALNAALYQNLLALDRSLKDVINAKEKSIFSRGRYDIINRQYLLDNINYFILSKKAQRLCKMDVVNVLYFFSDDCMSCPAQGTVLSYLKNLFGERLLVFPINVKTLEPLVDILKSKYGINNLPSVVVGEKTYEFTEREDLTKLICKEFKNEQEECK